MILDVDLNQSIYAKIKNGTMVHLQVEDSYIFKAVFNPFTNEDKDDIINCAPGCPPYITNIEFIKDTVSLEWLAAQAEKILEMDEVRGDVETLIISWTKTRSDEQSGFAIKRVGEKKIQTECFSVDKRVMMEPVRDGINNLYYLIAQHHNPLYYTRLGNFVARLSLRAFILAANVILGVEYTITWFSYPNFFRKK